MPKRVTVKDIAREAGVSIATVSYILNNRTDVKISESTRKKVIQIANLLNYIPSAAAKSLVTGKTNIIGIAFQYDIQKPARNLEILSFVHLLLERLNCLHYDIQFISTNTNDSSLFARAHVDGIIAIDLPQTVFKRLSDSYLVPIVTVDMLIDDTLFYQVYSNIPASIEKALQKTSDAIIVTEEFGNENYMKFIHEAIPKDQLCLISKMREPALKSLAGKKVIVIGTYLALMLRPYVKSSDMTVLASQDSIELLTEGCRKIEDDISKKANVTINLLLNAMDRHFTVEHRHCLNLIDSDSAAE